MDEPKQPDPTPGATALLEQVMTEHQAGLLRYAARFLNSMDAAQDVVQEVFIRFCRSWSPAVCPAERIRFWIYSLAHNVAVDHIRRESRLRELHLEHAERAGDSGANNELERRQQLVLANVSQLDPAERQVLLLRLEHGFSYHEISAVTNRSEGNVGCLLHHAVRNMSRVLKSQGVI